MKEEISLKTIQMLVGAPIDTQFSPHRVEEFRRWIAEHADLLDLVEIKLLKAVRFNRRVRSRAYGSGEYRRGRADGIMALTGKIALEYNIPWQFRRSLFIAR